MGTGLDGSQLLEQLDEAAELFAFPGLPNSYFDLAGTRLTVFRSDDEWLAVFQTVGWANREARFEDLVTAYGNSLSKVGLQKAVEVVTGPDGEAPVSQDDDFVLDIHDLKVEVRGKAHELSPTDADLSAAEVDVDSMSEPARVIRLLAHQLGDELFLSDDELLELTGRADAGLKPFIHADGWRQPDLVDDEVPSGLDCLRSLAEAIESGDADRYDCPEPNSHWINWED
jgi:hypothetical protein